jgi:heme-degrading monooxygenase HmoA
MFARATTFQSTPGTVDGGIRFLVRELAAAVEELPGFLGLIDLVNRQTGQAVTVTFWETEEARAASAEFARQAASKVAEEGAENVTSVNEYEVGVYTMTDGLSSRPLHKLPPPNA